jgi:hypothetical protein
MMQLNPDAISTLHAEDIRHETSSLCERRGTEQVAVGAQFQYRPRPRPRPTMALGPPSPATDGTEYGRYDNNGENTPCHPSPRLHTIKRELTVALDRPDMVQVPMARPRPTMALGPPSPATDGTEYVGDTTITAKIRPATRLPAFIQSNGS